MISLGGLGTVVDQVDLIALVNPKTRRRLLECAECVRIGRKNEPFILTLVKDGSYSVQMDDILVNIRDLGFEYLRLDLFLCYLMGFFFGYFSSTSDLDP